MTETVWYCTACGQRARPFSWLTLLDQSGRWARGRHCGGRRDLTTDKDKAEAGAAFHRARLQAEKETQE